MYIFNECERNHTLQCWTSLFIKFIPFIFSLELAIIDTGDMLFLKSSRCDYRYGDNRKIYCSESKRDNYRVYT